MAIEENETKTRRFQVAPSRVLEKQLIDQEIETEIQKRERKIVGHFWGGLFVYSLLVLVPLEIQINPQNIQADVAVIVLFFQPPCNCVIFQMLRYCFIFFNRLVLVSFSSIAPFLFNFCNCAKNIGRWWGLNSGLLIGGQR